jgi:hypothetical protein
MEGIGERERGARGDPETLPPLPPLGAISSFTDAGRRTIRDNRLKALDDGRSDGAVARVAPAAATAARARSRAAKPDGKRGCKTAGTGSASKARTGCSTPVDRSKKIRDHPLGAGPRAAGLRLHRPCPTPRDRHPGLGPLAAARRNDIGTAGSAPGVSPVRWPSADTAGRPAFAASAAPPRGTRGCSTGPGDGSVGRTSRTL